MKNLIGLIGLILMSQVSMAGSADDCKAKMNPMLLRQKENIRESASARVVKKKPTSAKKNIERVGSKKSY